MSLSGDKVKDDPAVCGGAVGVCDRVARSGDGSRKRHRLAGPFAREVRNPVASLITASEVLLKELGPEHRCAGYARLINDTSSRLHDAVSELLALAVPGEFRPTKSDLAFLVAGEIDGVAATAERNRVRFVTAFPAERVLVTADREALGLALRKVLMHQTEVMRCGGTLAVEVEALRRHRVRLLCSDTGPIVPPAQLPGVFDPFFSAEGRHPGMALAVFKRVVTRSGGRVCAWDKDGGGLTIEANLPAA